MNSVQDAFKANRAKKNVLMAAGLILTCVTLLSCVSSFQIYSEGFKNLPWFAQQGAALFAVIVVEGTFIWLLYGFTKAFSSMIERVGCLAGMVFIVAVMTANIITHFMMVKGMPLNSFQEAWISWGAVSVFIVVLVLVLVITMADPAATLTRQDLRIQGKQQRTVLTARESAIESDQVNAAMQEREEWESEQLASQIVGTARQIGYGSAGIKSSPALGTYRKAPPAPQRKK